MLYDFKNNINKILNMIVRYYIFKRYTKEIGKL